mgnify:CR=1 FL=1
MQISFVLCIRIFLKIDLQFIGSQLNKKAKQTFKAVWRWCTRQESNLQKTKRAAAEKKIKAAQHALERFEGEILKCLDGTSNFTEDMIAKQIRRYQQELDDAKAEYAELQNARLNEAAEIRKLRTYYDDFKGWAEEFDTAPLEMKRMILSHLIDRVEVGRKYQVIVKFNMKYRQFLECTAETYNTEIGA